LSAFSIVGSIAHFAVSLSVTEAASTTAARQLTEKDARIRPRFGPGFKDNFGGRGAGGLWITQIA